MPAAIASVILGVWLTISPAVLGYSGPARTTAHLLGPIVAAFAAMAISQVTRQLRLANLPVAASLLVAPLMFGYSLIPTLNSVATGVLLGVLSLFFRGSAGHRQGGGWAVLRRTPES